MTPGRLAEIRRHDASYETVRSVLGSNSAETHRHELLAEVQRHADEVDALNASADRAATAWHDLVAERDQARVIACILNRGDANLHLEYEIRLGLGMLPEWLTGDKETQHDA